MGSAQGQISLSNTDDPQEWTTNNKIALALSLLFVADMKLGLGIVYKIMVLVPIPLK